MDAAAARRAAVGAHGAGRGPADERGRRHHRRQPDHLAGHRAGRRPGIEAEIKAGWQPSPTAAQVSQLYTSAVTAGVVSCVALVAVWLWMARANGRGRNWARILFTVLSGPAALTLIFPQFVIVPQWVPLIGNNPLVIGFVPFAPIPFVPGAGRSARADRPGEPGRGVPAVAPGLQRVLQAVAALPAGPAAGAQDGSRADPVVRETVPAPDVSRAGLRARADAVGGRRLLLVFGAVPALAGREPVDGRAGLGRRPAATRRPRSWASAKLLDGAHRLRAAASVLPRPGRPGTTGDDSRPGP